MENVEEGNTRHQSLFDKKKKKTLSELLDMPEIITSAFELFWLFHARAVKVFLILLSYWIMMSDGCYDPWSEKGHRLTIDAWMSHIFEQSVYSKFSRCSLGLLASVSGKPGTLKDQRSGAAPSRNEQVVWIKLHEAELKKHFFTSVNHSIKKL